MEQIKRYVYAVTRQLPQKQRPEIERELHSLIEDMVEERVLSGKDAESATEEVLLELGNPNALAANYRGKQRFLISPELFYSYMVVMKIVLISIFVSMTAVFAIEFILNPMEIAVQFANYLLSLFMVIIQGFAWVTISFAIIEYAGVKFPKNGPGTKKEWKPSQLSPVPNPSTLIKPSEPITSIIFSILFLVLFTFSTHMFGIFVFQEGQLLNVVPFFNEEVFRRFIPIIWLLIALSILRDCLKIITKKWTKSLIGLHILFVIASFLLALIMFTNPMIWNSNFTNDLVEFSLLSEGSETFDLVATIWERATQGIIYVIALITLIDIIHTSLKAYRMKNAG